MPTDTQIDHWYSSMQLLPDQPRHRDWRKKSPQIQIHPRARLQGDASAIPHNTLTTDKNDQANNWYPYVHLLPNNTLFIFVNTKSIKLNHNSKQVVKTYPVLPDGPRNYPSCGSSVMLPLRFEDSSIPSRCSCASTAQRLVRFSLAHHAPLRIGEILPKPDLHPASTRSQNLNRALLAVVVIALVLAVLIPVAVVLQSRRASNAEARRLFEIRAFKHRTAFHFQPDKNWMNDPNGPMYYKGYYHLFYQYNPEGAVWGNIIWGHAVSTDLVNWRHLELALQGDQWYDIQGIWLGSATLLPDGSPIVMYTGWSMRLCRFRAWPSLPPSRIRCFDTA